MDRDAALALLVDGIFCLTGTAVAAVQIARRRSVPKTEPAPAPTWSELVLTVCALAAAAVSPNLIVVATTPGMPEMPALARYALVPSVVLLSIVLVASARSRRVRLTNRIVVGLWAGAAATGLLEAVRIPGFHLGFMPGDLPRILGVRLLDQLAVGPSVGSDVVGHVYHFWVGASFGMIYTLALGRIAWWGGLVWGLFIGVGMLVTPPTVVAMDAGYFGLKFGPRLLVTALVAHVAFGSALGLLAQRYVRHDGTIVGLLRGRLAKEPPRSAGRKPLESAASRPGA